MRRLRVFISYAKEDAPVARSLFLTLPPARFSVFLDEYCIPPGVAWEQEIRRSIRIADAILVLLSQKAGKKRGFVQKEIRFALAEAEQLPEGRTFIYPILLEDCQVPETLEKWQWLRYYEEGSWENLIRSLEQLEQQLLPELKAAEDDGGYWRKVDPRSRLVMFVRGLNLSGEPIYSYIELPLGYLLIFKERMANNENIDPRVFGTVLASGTGEPPEELVRDMREKYNMVDFSTSTKQDEPE